VQSASPLTNVRESIRLSRVRKTKSYISFVDHVWVLFRFIASFIPECAVRANSTQFIPRVRFVLKYMYVNES